MHKFVVIMLAIAVCLVGFDADAKKKRIGHRRTAKRTIVQPEPKDYGVLKGDYEGVMEFEKAKYPPEYPGGMEGLMKFLSKNIKYPKSAEKNGIQGIVVVQFIVEKTGAISNVKVLKSVEKSLDKEAVSSEIYEALHPRLQRRSCPSARALHLASELQTGITGVGVAMI